MGYARQKLFPGISPPHTHLKKKNHRMHLPTYMHMLWCSPMVNGVMGWNVPPHKRYVKVLTSSTYACDLIRKERLCINVIKLGYGHTEVGCALSNMTGILMKREKTTYRHSKGQEHMKCKSGDTKDCQQTARS